jgi:hypothetical protein
MFCRTYLGLRSLGLNLGCRGEGRHLNPLNDQREVSDRWTTCRRVNIVAWIFRALLDSGVFSGGLVSGWSSNIRANK